MDQAFDAGQRVGRAIGQPAGQFVDLAFQVAVRHHSVDDAQAGRLMGVEAVAEQGDLHGFFQTHRAWQEITRRAVGAGRDIDIGEGEKGVVGGDR